MGKIRKRVAVRRMIRPVKRKKGKGNLEAIYKALEIVDKHKLDFSYLSEK